MTLIRLCAAQKEVVGDGEGKGMKETRGSPAGKCSCGDGSNVTIVLSAQDTVLDQGDMNAQIQTRFSLF